MAVIAVVTLVALMAVVTLVVMAVVAMVAFVAATGIPATTWCNPVLKSFHFENTWAHLVLLVKG